MIYGRFGNPLTITRRAVLQDVKALDKRTPDKTDKAAIKSGSYVVTLDNETGRESLYHLAYLRADDGSKEITAAIEALA